MKAKYWLLIGIILLSFYLIWSSRSLYSNLPVTSAWEHRNHKIGFIWEPGMPMDMFPYFSPDGRYYVEVERKLLRPLWVLNMYRSSDGKKVGAHACITLRVHSWLSDSSGIFVYDAGITLIGEGGWLGAHRLFAKPFRVVLLPEDK